MTHCFTSDMVFDTAVFCNITVALKTFFMHVNAFFVVIVLVLHLKVLRYRSEGMNKWVLILLFMFY